MTMPAADPPLPSVVLDPAVTRSVAERVPGARYVGVPGARHSIAAEWPDLVARLIGDHLLQPRGASGPS